MSSIPSQQPERRYRNLPATPSFSPFAANPLYSSSGSQKECSYITPQFPDSVVAFAKLNGLGCDPQYPQIQPGTCSKPVLEDIPPQIDDPIGTIPLSHTQATSAKYDKRTAFPSKRLLLQSFREKGKLMSWGCTFYGALGVQRGVPFNSEEHDGGAAGGEEVEDGWKLSDYCLTPSQTLVPTVAAMVACGQHSSYIVSAEGTLFSCGRGDMGQLGIGERGLQFPRRGVSKFHKVHLKDDERVSMVVGGYCTAMVLTSENYLYCWGNNSYGQCLKRTSGPVADSPLRFKTGKHYAVDVAQGMTFGALVFDDGALGTWGESTMLGGIVPEEDLEVLGAHGTKCMCKVFQPRFSQRIKCVRAGQAHGMAITEKGTVLTWGCGKGGRLGHGTEDDEVQARRVKALSAHCIVDGSCGSYHTAVVARTGDVFVFGENQKNQLGLFGRQPRRLPETLSLPHPALTVSCGREHTCILLVDGDVMVCGAARCAGLGFGNGLRARAPTRILQSYITLNVASGVSHSIASVVPRITSFSRVGSMSFAGLSKLKNVPIRSAIRSIAGGVNFIILTLETDATISVGRGEQGQLGLGDCMRPARRGDVTAASSFQRVRLPKEVCLQSVSCGPDFVVAIDRRGDIYGWGSNRHGQLCQSVENQQDVFTPVKIRDAYADHQAAQIACGGTFVVALTVEGEVLVHGERAYCGLELPKKDGIHEEGQTRLVTIPTPITSLRGIQAVAAGKTHAMALSSTGTLYTWGSGVLGTGAAATSAYAPVKISLLQNIRKIGCGPATSFAINDAGELLVWGMNSNRQCGVAEDVVLSPVVAHTRVRDAAFAGEVGAVITEGGELRLSGRHHGSTGKVQQLDSFAAEPQPRVLGERSGELGDAASAFTSSRVMAPAETTPTPVEDGLTPPSSARDQGSATRRHDPNAATSPSWALHCAGGWDQILVVAESRRPTAAEVQDAHRGLAALVHEGPQREVVE